MIYIPLEVLHEIFTMIRLENRLECMFVCRAWYNFLDRCSLLYDLDINVANFDKAKNMLENFSHRRPQVEYLTLDLPQRHEFDKRVFFNFCPNL
jgi:hypothetical protein